MATDAIQATEAKFRTDPTLPEALLQSPGGCLKGARS